MYHGTFLSHTEFRIKYLFDCTNIEYSRVIKAVSPKLIQLIKTNVHHSSIFPQLPSLIDNVLPSDLKRVNKLLRSSLTYRVLSLPIKKNVSHLFQIVILVILDQMYFHFPSTKNEWSVLKQLSIFICVKNFKVWYSW